MKDWQLSQSDPLHLTLAADARISPPDYVNDHIWEIKLNGGTPPSLSVQTTYGLRARLMSLFPRFNQGEDWLSDPELFFRPPRVTRFHPNYIVLNFAPYNNFEVEAEYWATNSQILSGRLTFSNPGEMSSAFTFEWIGLLSHLGEGQGMAVTEIGISQVLEGKTSGIFPVCVMTGGPRPGSGPYAGLAYDIQLEPGESRQITWVLTSLENPKAGFDLARLTTARPWEAEIARIELVDESQSLQITTGDTDWDAAIAFSQRAANSLFFPESHHLPHQSFVLSRQPENGSSLRGDGNDYDQLWNGQTVLDSWYIHSLLGPGQAHRMAGLVENFVHARGENGFIDWKPGLAGQRAKRLAQPMIAVLALKIFNQTQDLNWLEKVYPHLWNFLRCWFRAEHDRDQDGFPEWDHPFQIGLDEIPLFHPWHEDAQGVDPEAVESPSLAAMLYREAGSLAEIAELLGRDADAAWLNERQAVLSAETEKTWNEQESTYYYRDALTHGSSAGTLLLEINSTGIFPIMQSFGQPQRFLLRFIPQGEMTRQNLLLIYGETPEGPVTEEVNPRKIHWLHGVGRYTTQHHFIRLIEVAARIMLPGDRCEVRTIDFTSEDISLLLPLWAGIPDTGRAEKIIKETILPRYLQPFGLTACPIDRCPANSSAASVYLPWNQMVGEGMLHYGYRGEAARLVTVLLNAVVKNLKESHAFYTALDPVTGKGYASRNTLTGLAPVGLFLEVLGLKKISAEEVIVAGLNPFSHPVTVQYRGTKVHFSSQHTQVTFAGGQSATVSDDDLHTISLP